MNRFQIITELSPWYILLCIITGAFYAYLLYSKKQIWSKQVSYFLSALRFTVVFILCVLLLVPLIKQLKNFVEEPTIAFVIDNSESIEPSQLIKKLDAIGSKLTSAGYKVEWNTLSESNVSPSEIKFDQKITNLSQPIKTVENNFINRNLHSAILISDGIHNQGFSPEYLKSSFPIYTVGIGDTTTQKDIAIREVFYNKIVYNGNKFPIKTRFIQNGFNEENVIINVKKNGNILQSRTVNLGDKSIHEIEFILESSTYGKQAYNIEILPLDNEFTIENNSREIYIQVIDGKERILIYAGSPHPDIKAIRGALESKENLEIVVYYDGLKKTPSGLFDLVILHQFPSKKIKNSEVLSSLLKPDTPVWYFIGNNSDIKSLNDFQETISINLKSNSNDLVFGAKNSDFTGFNLENENLNNMSKLPPIEVVFAEFNTKGKSQDLLLQKVGSLTTNKPILTFVEKENGVKNAVFIGEGLWKWKLHEFSLYENSEGIDELIQKTVRYITTKKDKRQLRVNPSKEEFFTTESVKLDVEVYNDIYEKTFQKEINIAIENEAGIKKEFQFVNDENNSRFSIGQLDNGVYNFKATSSLNGKLLKDEGSFVVKEQFLEKISTQADFNLLQQLASNTDGKFYSIDELEMMTKDLINRDHKSKIVLSDEIRKELINQKWLFFLLLLLVTVEWALRKYQGDY